VRRLVTYLTEEHAVDARALKTEELTLHSHLTAVLPHLQRFARAFIAGSAARSDGSPGVDSVGDVRLLVMVERGLVLSLPGAGVPPPPFLCPFSSFVDVSSSPAHTQTSR
jgi:hypothetical protein